MKHQPKPENADTQTKLPPLKSWTKENLTPEDWDFPPTCKAIESAVARVPDDAANGIIYRAFTWELDRELGSGNGPFDAEKRNRRHLSGVGGRKL